MRVLNGISELLSNESLSGDSTISQGEGALLLDLVTALIEADAVDGLETLADQIEDIAAQGRGPNHLEWALFRASYEALQPDEEEEAAPEAPPPEPVPAPASDETDDEEEGDPEGAPV